MDSVYKNFYFFPITESEANTVLWDSKSNNFEGLLKKENAVYTKNYVQTHLFNHNKSLNLQSWQRPQTENPEK